MKKYFLMVTATLVVSAAAIVGVKAYNYYSMPELMRANLEALTNNIEISERVFIDCEKKINSMCTIICPGPACGARWAKSQNTITDHTVMSAMGACEKCSFPINITISNSYNK